jgi:hypothetical protein
MELIKVEEQIHDPVVKNLRVAIVNNRDIQARFFVNTTNRIFLTQRTVIKHSTYGVK